MGSSTSKLCNVGNIASSQKIVQDMLRDYELTQYGGNITSEVSGVKSVILSPYSVENNTPPPKISKYSAQNITNKIRLDSSIDETGELNDIIQSALSQHLELLRFWSDPLQKIGSPDQSSGDFGSKDIMIMEGRKERLKQAKGELLQLDTILKKECKEEEKENIAARQYKVIRSTTTLGGGLKNKKSRRDYETTNMKYGGGCGSDHFKHGKADTKKTTKNVMKGGRKLSITELHKRASVKNIKGYSKMSESQLRKALGMKPLK